MPQSAIREGFEIGQAARAWDISARTGSGGGTEDSGGSCRGKDHARPPIDNRAAPVSRTGIVRRENGCLDERGVGVGKILGLRINADQLLRLRL